MNEEEKYNLIEKYITDEMSADEKNSFEDQLKQDSSLREEVDLHRQAERTLKGEKVHELRNVLKEVNREWKSQETIVDTLVDTRIDESKVVNFPFRKIAAIAASILALVIAYQVFTTNTGLTNSQLFAANFEPYQMILSQRTVKPEESEENKISQQINEAVVAYQTQDFTKAAILFRELQDDTPDAALFRLYIAISELSLGHSDKAIAILEGIIEDGAPLFIEQSRWYLAMAYLQKEEALAKKYFSEIKKGEYQFDDAQEILKSLTK